VKREIVIITIAILFIAVEFCIPYCVHANDFAFYGHGLNFRLFVGDYPWVRPKNVAIPLIWMISNDDSDYKVYYINKSWWNPNNHEENNLIINETYCEPGKTRGIYNQKIVSLPPLTRESFVELTYKEMIIDTIFLNIETDYAYYDLMDDYAWTHCNYVQYEVFAIYNAESLTECNYCWHGRMVSDTVLVCFFIHSDQVNKSSWKAIKINILDYLIAPIMEKPITWYSE